MNTLALFSSLPPVFGIVLLFGMVIGLAVGLRHHPKATVLLLVCSVLSIVGLEQSDTLRGEIANVTQLKVK